MTHIPVTSISVHKNCVFATTASGEQLNFGKMTKTEKCIYDNCRARNLCAPKMCVGKKLIEYNIMIEDGGIVRVN